MFNQWRKRNLIHQNCIVLLLVLLSISISHLIGWLAIDYWGWWWLPASGFPMVLSRLLSGCTGMELSLLSLLTICGESVPSVSMQYTYISWVTVNIQPLVLFDPSHYLTVIIIIIKYTLCNRNKLISFNFATTLWLRWATRRDNRIVFL